MTLNAKTTWDIYTSSWKAATAAEKKALFEQSLDPACEYQDPLVSASGWDALLNYMHDFHQQVPGGSFVTRHFLSHHQQSMARWEMLDGDNKIIGEGLSHGRYNDSGKLIAMTGFFDTP